MRHVVGQYLKAKVFIAVRNSFTRRRGEKTAVKDSP